MTDSTNIPQASQDASESAVPPAAADAPSIGAAANTVREKSSFAYFGSAASQRILLVVAVGATGLLGGAAATSAYYETATRKIASSNDTLVLSEAVRKLETSVSVLSTAASASAKMNNANWSKIGERLEKIEKSFTEPNNRLAAVTDAIEKLRAAAPAKVMPSDVTGSISAAPKPPAEPQKPVLSNWILHEVGRGIATIESRQGIFDVAVGDQLPGLDRVEAIRRQDDRWVVVTRKGIIVAR